MLEHIRAQIVAEGIGIPLCPSQQMLYAIGRCITIHFRQLPAIFARHRTEQASDIGPSAAPRFAAGKAWQYMAFHLGQPKRPFTYRLQREVGWRCAPLLPQLHGSTLHKLCGTMIAQDLQL
jgi:hypothetical protein